MFKLINGQIHITDDGKVMESTTTFDNGMKIWDCCAIGRFSEWPTKMRDVWDVQRSNRVADIKDRRRGEML